MNLRIEINIIHHYQIGFNSGMDQHTQISKHNAKQNKGQMSHY
jgi:hypothetical protein